MLHLDSQERQFNMTESHITRLLFTTESVKRCTSAATLHTDFSDMVIKRETIRFNNNKKITSLGAYCM